MAYKQTNREQQCALSVHVYTCQESYVRTEKLKTVCCKQVILSFTLYFPKIGVERVIQVCKVDGPQWKVVVAFFLNTNKHGYSGKTCTMKDYRPSILGNGLADLNSSCVQHYRRSVNWLVVTIFRWKI